MSKVKGQGQTNLITSMVYRSMYSHHVALISDSVFAVFVRSRGPTKIVRLSRHSIIASNNTLTLSWHGPSRSPPQPKRPDPELSFRSPHDRPDHPWGWWGWNLRARASTGARTDRYNENLQSRTTLGPEISREKICDLLKILPSGISIRPIHPTTKQHF